MSVEPKKVVTIEVANLESVATAIRSGITTVELMAEYLSSDIVEGYLVLPDAPIWACDDDGDPESYPSDTEPEDAAEKYVSNGNWGGYSMEMRRTVYVQVETYRQGVNSEGKIGKVGGHWYNTCLDPDEPNCTGNKCGHKWSEGEDGVCFFCDWRYLRCEKEQGDDGVSRRYETYILHHRYYEKDTKKKDRLAAIRALSLTEYEDHALLARIAKDGIGEKVKIAAILALDPGDPTLADIARDGNQKSEVRIAAIWVSTNKVMLAELSYFAWPNSVEEAAKTRMTIYGGA